ncbi:hypothetical protein ACFE04_007801 [Oxalis oulophora]
MAKGASSGSSSLSSSPQGPSPDNNSFSKKNSKRPKYSKFTQQELPACKPILTPGLVITTFIVVGILFIPIGLSSLFASERVVQIVDQYDKDCVPPNFKNNELAYIQDPTVKKTCTRSFMVGVFIASFAFNFNNNLSSVPVVVMRNMSFAELDEWKSSFSYVKSRSDAQLRSKASEGVTKTCDPEGVTSDGRPIVPCGLIAWSLFNDTYDFSVNDKAIDVTKTNIAWKSDQERKFGADVFPKNFQSGSLIGGGKLNESIPLSEQEDLIVWMRTAALPTFRKLYGRIEQDLQPNVQINVVIENNYNTYSFGGGKRLVLSTTTWIGGKNDFLGYAYLTIGGLCLFLAITSILVYVIKPRPLGDPSYLSWNRNPAGHLN